MRGGVDASGETEASRRNRRGTAVGDLDGRRVEPPTWRFHAPPHLEWTQALFVMP